MPYKNSNYHKEYYQKNKDRINAQTSQWKKDNPDKAREIVRKSHKKYTESSVEAFLRKTLIRIRSKANECAKDKYDEYDINLEYIMELWSAQNGKCALTNKKMTHKINSLFSVSVDRIDSNVGYIQGNIQLVCQSVNYAKNNFTNEEFLHFWNNKQELKCENESM